jgi:hypothetical protein
VAELSQLANAVLSAVCVIQAAVVIFPGQFNVTGGSTVEVKVCVQVELLMQPSVAVYVRVWECRQPFDVISPSEEVIVGVP